MVVILSFHRCDLLPLRFLLQEGIRGAHFGRLQRISLRGLLPSTCRLCALHLTALVARSDVVRLSRNLSTFPSISLAFAFAAVHCGRRNCELAVLTTAFVLQISVSRAPYFLRRCFARAPFLPRARVFSRRCPATFHVYCVVIEICRSIGHFISPNTSAVTDGIEQGYSRRCPNISSCERLAYY